ncbi:MAG TPA: fumarylacetoacetate hydrolase family protein [Acidimicrobiales bacterium]|nr:fumarylacetoacetate hydrolase family protein [Acidimicrobiales bacterium]
MTEAEVSEVAGALATAHERCQPIPPVVETHPEAALEDAYGIQRALVAALTAKGATLKGRKVGLTSAVMQRALSVSEPDFGCLLDTMFHPDGAGVAAGRFIAPRVEPEVAFVLRRELAGPGVTMAEAIAAVDFVLPALEIIDSRIVDWRISLVDTVADNASSGGVVLGGCPRRIDGLDLRLLGCNVWRNGALAATGAAGAVLGNPLNALVWLANRLATFGEGIEAGSVVMPGSCTAATPVVAGDVVSASFAGLGQVTVRFEGRGS